MELISDGFGSYVGLVDIRAHNSKRYQELRLNLTMLIVFQDRRSMHLVGAKKCFPVIKQGVSDCPKWLYGRAFTDFRTVHHA